MIDRWSRADRAAHAGKVPVSALRADAERVVASGVDAQELYRRWEQQHWTVGDLRLDEDRANWDRVPAASREVLLRLFTSFYVGEYTAVDGLAAVMAGAPDEDELVFLATQSADEARHVAFMNLVDRELMDGTEGLKARLPQLWEQLTPAYRALQRIEDAFAEDVLRRPDIDTWLRLVSVFHLLTEGVMAINGQQAVLRALRAHTELPQVEAGFIGMMRDESRHIAYGTQAARRWVKRGFEEHVLEAMELAVPHVVHIDDRPGASNPLAAKQLAKLVDRRLAAVGVSRKGREHIAAVARRTYSIEGDAADGSETQVSGHPGRDAEERGGDGSMQSKAI
ncbi:ribonucleotide-diphosphate reductase subunit beta [Saccharomonospora glauca]|uniref:Ribonucleotide reductase, beta subunit n=1 Tax=Saccharomonospora glauca K62 TaxID=928724 RepID=I1CYP8_9PSEU|nr:ribonucleotide-diphosphate reductase subunit beta [Saccharomonospora glauca]EIE97822.1 ribonucleotide reductase, beta subunit [Saccharomonospora glauca K62]